MQYELVDDESVIKDVKLIGSDGRYVMAAKAILTIQSPVFRRMFYGNVREAYTRCDSVELDFCTPVLQIMVLFSYTREIRLSLLPEDMKDLNRSALVALLEVREKE